MTQIDRKRAFASPDAVFSHPFEVLHSNDLSYDEKVKVLRNWKQSLEQLQTASEENMLNEGGQSDVSIKLAAVTNALIEMRAT
jgi:hypothetical protein